jgi:outer membrane biosynthesis protein TonB
MVVVRYVNSGPDALIAPLIDFSVNQLTGFIVGLMGTALFLFYAYLYAPTLPEKPEEDQEPPRKAQFYYKKPPTPVEIEDKPVAHNAPVTEKTKEPPAPSRGQEGASSAPKHSNTTNKVAKQKGTTTHAQSAAAPAKPKPKDVSKTGLLGAFASHGMQADLNKAYQGAGNAAGAAKAATGAASEGEGEGPGGNALKDVGANGNGTATVGIAGVKTHGRGGGVSGYGTGGLGAKKNASLIAGDDQATFSGTIDKEAIRRVVQANLKQIKACYERGLNRDPSLYGKIVIQWTIGPGGRVLEAGIKNTTMNSAEVESCAVARLRTWKFPEPPAGEVAVVSYPFVFQAQE